MSKITKKWHKVKGNCWKKAWKGTTKKGTELNSEKNMRKKGKNIEKQIRLNSYLYINLPFIFNCFVTLHLIGCWRHVLEQEISVISFSFCCLFSASIYQTSNRDKPICMFSNNYILLLYFLHKLKTEHRPEHHCKQLGFYKSSIVHIYRKCGSDVTVVERREPFSDHTPQMDCSPNVCHVCVAVRPRGQNRGAHSALHMSSPVACTALLCGEHWEGKQK